MNAFPSHLPVVNCPLFRSVYNRQIKQQISVLTIFRFPQSDPIVIKYKSYIKKNSGQKSKKNVGVPLTSLKKWSIFCQIFIVLWLELYKGELVTVFTIGCCPLNTYILSLLNRNLKSLSHRIIRYGYILDWRQPYYV